MTIAEIAANYHYAVSPIDESFGYHRGVYATGAHDSDYANVRCVLYPGNSSEIGGRIPSPGAAKNQNLGRKI
jgi:hypothetical protein